MQPFGYCSPQMGKRLLMKSERLKKLETEFEDLEQWKRLGLVPKKDVIKHNEEIRLIKLKIEEEKERLRFMKESGEGEEFTAPKRGPSKQPYAEPQTLPDMEMGIDTDVGLDLETENFDEGTATTEEEASPVTEEAPLHEEAAEEEESEEAEDPFSDTNRWKRGVWEDPDSDNW
jgi:hypothetical protein